MKLVDAYVAWTAVDRDTLSSAGQVFVGTKQQMQQRTSGADRLGSWMPLASFEWAERPAEGVASVAAMLLMFHTLVVRDGIAPEDAHSAFLVVDEYRWHISRDIKGAEDQP